MNKVKEFISNYIKYLGDDNISLDYKSLYMVSFFSIPSWIAYVIIFSIYNEIGCVLVSLVIAVFFTAIIYLLHRYDDIDFLKFIMLFCMNIFIFPLSFFVTGDMYNGAILYFPLGIMTTFLVIRKKIVYFVATVEFAWYCYVLYLPIKKYEVFTEYRKGHPLGIGIIPSFLLAALITSVVIIHQTIAYNRTHKKLLESSDIIEEAKFNKSRFLANMTHEIRNPMNSIVGMNELILRENLNSESRELAENIKASSNQLLRIINNILEFSKLDSNKMELYPSKYDFKQMILETINAVSVEYASDDNELYVDIDSKIPSVLFGDSARIKQVFLYIMFSALHKLPHNRIMFKISGDVDRATNTVMLSCSIAESGMGLSEKEIEAMLSAYTNFDSRQKSDYKGMGLELSICKEILELMGGSLRIESVEGVGVSVRFEFVNYIIDEKPIAQLSLLKNYSVLVYCDNNYEKDIWNKVLAPFQIYPTIVNGPNAFRNAIENRRYTHVFIDSVYYAILQDTIKEAQISDNVYVVSAADGVYSDADDCKIIRRPLSCINIASAINDEWQADAYRIAAKKEAVIYPQAKVLIVDDSIVNLKVLEGMLSTFEINVTTCKSGKEALEVLADNEFDMLILDQRMPEMDGIELLHNIRKLSNINALIPVLCATADFGQDIYRMLIKEGFQDYLAKPVRRHYLERMLRSFLPVELAVNIKVEDKNPKETKKTEISVPEIENPQDIHFDIGESNVGGSKEAFAAVASAYYKEGMDKIAKLDGQYNSDLSLYVIDVHALKSSSAAIGAQGMSELFKQLEFAGRANNMEFLEAHTGPTLKEFEGVLEKVKSYLVDNGLWQEETSVVEATGDEVALDANELRTAYDALAGFNLKTCEDKLKELITVNYGDVINKKIKEIYESYERFDYHKVKDDLLSLIDFIG